MASKVTFPDDLLARIQGLQRSARDPSEILDTLRKIAVADNRREALGGFDRQGRPYAPLAPSTRENRKGNGPPLAPQRDASRIIANYRVSAAVTGKGEISMVGYWVDFSVPSGKWAGYPIPRFFVTGTRNMPARDPRGPRPAGRQEMSDAMKDWFRSKWGGAAGAWLRGKFGGGA